MASSIKKDEEKIIDYISGIEVNVSPEEVDAVQVFARQLVEDYGYPKEHIQTRPQYRVKLRPSDKKKEYPVDIAVFTNEKKTESELYIIVECKKKTRKDGRTQLENYLTLSNACLGVWFNGEERFFLRKFVRKSGGVFFEEIPNIPQYGERIENIGKFVRANLKPTHNLKTIFKSIRGYLAANNVGATRDEMLAQQLINIIFCKIYDEKYTPPTEIVRFRAGVDEKAKEIEQRVLALFDEVKKTLPEVIDKEDKINLDTNSIRVVAGELQNYSLTTCERDVIADAFETFIGHALKGGQGQFFTPRNVVKMVVDILQPSEYDMIIDPACGSGGFLIESLKFVWEQIDKKYQNLGWGKSDIDRRKIDAAANYWNSGEQEIEKIAEEQNCTLVAVQDLISAKVIKYFDGHGSPEADNKGMGEVPYIRVKDIVNWEIYKDPTALIPYHVFADMRKDTKKLCEKDLLFVRRGSYRIGSVALVSPYDTEVLLTREILVLRIIDEANKYNLSPYYLIYLFAHYLTQMQMRNKVLMETTLPNIGNRWQELRLPIHNDIKIRALIDARIKAIFDKKWDAQKGILEIKKELGDLTT